MIVGEITIDLVEIDIVAKVMSNNRGTEGVVKAETNAILHIDIEMIETIINIKGDQKSMMTKNIGGIHCKIRINGIKEVGQGVEGRRTSRKRKMIITGINIKIGTLNTITIAGEEEALTKKEIHGAH